VAGQVTAEPAQLPFVQTSDVVHALLSLQLVPLEAFGVVQTPVACVQVPAPWHWSMATHVTGEPAMQDPPPQ